MLPSLLVVRMRPGWTMLWPIRVVLTGVLAGVVVLLSVPLHAQLIVNDPLNYAQNVLTAARSLQQINIALMGLAN